ncbi:MAG: hypothetical protein QM770_03380 [Tepidisphaeraceae bacterium]
MKLASMTAALVLAACSAVFSQTSPAAGTQTVRVMTYNTENWSEVFYARKLQKELKNHPDWPAEMKELITISSKAADSENWARARVILDDAAKPDILIMQEGCEQEDLNYVNTQYLKGYFDTVHVFPTNTERDQNTAILCRPGFKVLEYRQDYHNEPDTNKVNVVGTGKLFARGPGFAHIQAPNGTTFWVGTNHAKSKSDNSVPVTKWRNAEAVRTHEILMDLRKSDPEVIFAGDMNDELGFQEFEQEAGGSAIDLILGPPSDGLVLATRALSDGGAISYHGGFRGRHRSFIDHAFLSPEAAGKLKDVHVVTTVAAELASDHFPVVMTFEFSK